MSTKLVTNIRTSRNPVGIAANVGTKLPTLKATVKRIGHAWYNKT